MLTTIVSSQQKSKKSGGTLIRFPEYKAVFTLKFFGFFFAMVYFVQ